MNPTVYIRPLVPPHLFRFGQGLEKALPRGHNSFVLYHTKISLLVDPYDVKADTSDQKLIDVAFNGSVDILLIDGLPDGIPYAAFDIWRRDKPEDHKEKIKLFHRLGISYRCLESRTAIAQVAEIAGHVSAIVPEVDELRMAINPGQWGAMERVATVASKNKLYLLHEVALGSVIAFQDVKADGSGKGLPLFLNRDFLGRTSFDAIVTTPPPNAKPICAVEFDGRHHDEREQKNRDGRKDAACEEAKLPLIRIPARDTTVSKSNGTVVAFPNPRSLDTPEISWKLLEAIVTALSETHLRSTWYLRQLHQFLELEAEHLVTIDPDSSVTIQSYAEEIWNLATGRISELEERLEEIIESDREKATYAEWEHEYHRIPDQEAEEELYRGDEVPYRVREQLAKNFEKSVLRRIGPIRLFDIRSWSEPTRDGRGKRHMMSIESSPLLNELGVPISRKTFTEGPFGLTVVGDPYGIATDLINKIPRQFLLERVKQVALSHRSRIQAAAEAGHEMIWVYATASIWSGTRLDLLRDHLRARVREALRVRTLDTAKMGKKFSEDGHLQPVYREVPVDERLEKLTDLARRVRLVIERLSIEAEDKAALSDFFEDLLAKCQADPDSIEKGIKSPW